MTLRVLRLGVSLRWKLAWTILLLLLGSAAPALAIDGGVPLPNAPEEAPVFAYNRTITVLRTRFLGISAIDRAHRTERWIDELLEHEGPGAVTVQHEPQGSAILIDGSLALILTAGDADALRGETLDGATRSAVANLQHAVNERREARARGEFPRELIRCGAATAIFLLSLVLVLRVRRWLVSRIATSLERRTKNVHMSSTLLLQSFRLFELSRWVVRVVSSVIVLLLAYQWAAFTLNQFPYTRPWSKQLYAFLLGVVSDIGGSILRAVPDLIVALVIFWLARALTQAINAFFEGVRRSQHASTFMEPNAARATRRIANAAVWVFAVVMVYPYLPGSHSEAFKGVTVLIGLIATLGGSSLFGQVASGISLMYLNTFRVGEYVRIGDQEGIVAELGAFTTKIRTILGEEVTLSNSFVIGTTTKNFSRPSQGQGSVLETGVTIGYDAPWRQVQAMLVEAAHRTSGVLADPEPRVFQTALSDFYVEYRLVCQLARTWTAQQRADALTELHGHVLDVFNEYGVQIMSPHYLGDPAQAKVVPRNDFFAAPARKPPEPSSEE